jgi:hypothetical protein
LATSHPKLREPIIADLLREGETMNIIAPPKFGKSWLAADLALTVVTGCHWLGRHWTHRGNVLVVDNELHPETSAYRIPKVAEAKWPGVNGDAWQDGLFVQNLRGHLVDINGMAKIFAQFKPGDFRLVIIDAMYRALPPGTDENDNGAMAAIYNTIDSYAMAMQCGFVLIHHSSKGNQASKSITDVGSGAGAQSRAADAHLIMRAHEEPGIVVLEGAGRSFQGIEPICLRWEFPTFTPAEGLDPGRLKVPAKRATAKPTTTSQAGEAFAFNCGRALDLLQERGPMTTSMIKRALKVGGTKAKEIVVALEDEGEIERDGEGDRAPWKLAQKSGGTGGTVVLGQSRLSWDRDSRSALKAEAVSCPIPGLGEEGEEI